MKQFIVSKKSRFWDLHNQRVEVGSWRPSFYAYITDGAHQLLLVSDKDKVLFRGVYRNLKATEAAVNYSGMQNLACRGTYFSYHKVVAQ